MTTVKSIGLSWLEILNLARMTDNKPPLPDTHIVSEDWIRKLIKSEHSPLRGRIYLVTMKVPYFVAMHFRTHHVGIDHFISTSRTDRTGESERPPQTALVTYTAILNAQAILNTSRKRMCLKSSPETRKAWTDVVSELNKVDPLLAEECKPQCLHLGRCTEFKSCGFYDKYIGGKSNV